MFADLVFFNLCRTGCAAAFRCTLAAVYQAVWCLRKLFPFWKVGTGEAVLRGSSCTLEASR